MHVYPADDGLSVFIKDVTESVERREELEQVRSELQLTEQQFRALIQKLSKPKSPFR